MEMARYRRCACSRRSVQARSLCQRDSRFLRSRASHLTKDSPGLLAQICHNVPRGYGLTLILGMASCARASERTPSTQWQKSPAAQQGFFVYGVRSVSRRERFGLSREFLRQRVEIPRELRNASIVLLKVRSEIGALGARERDAFDLDIRDGGCAVLGSAYAEAQPDRLCVRGFRIDELGLHQGIVGSAIRRPGDFERLAFIAVQGIFVDGNTVIREGTDKAIKV